MKHRSTLMYGAIIYSVLLGAIYSAFAILGLLARWCVLETQNYPLFYMLYLFYFRVERCEPWIQWFKFSIINDVDAILPYESHAVYRTYIFTIIYLVLNVALIAFALLALCGTKSSVSRRSSCYTIPLIFILILTVVFDILVTVYYAIDFTSVMKDDGLMRILEVRNMDQVRKYFEQLPYTARYVPPIMMLMISSKIFLFLILNIFWAVVITYKKFGKSKQIDENATTGSKTSQNTTLTAKDNPAFELDSKDEKSLKKIETPKSPISEERYNDTARVNNFIFPHQLLSSGSKKQEEEDSLDGDWINRKDDEVFDDDSNDFKIQRPILTASCYKNARQSKLQQFPNSYPYDKDIENRLSRFHKSNGNVEYEEQSIDIIFKEMKSKPTPPPKPNRQEVHLRPSSSYYLNSTGHEDSMPYRSVSVLSDSRTDRSSGHLKTSQELRSQLPWSYFKIGDEVPRHALMHIDDNEIPGTPVPDYEISESRRSRHYNKSEGY